jgi:lipopolysaccharide export system protein LptA
LDPERHIELFADEGVYSGSLSESNLRGNVLLHSVDPYLVPVTVTGETGWFQSVSRLAKLQGQVHMYRGNLTASAETADLNGMLGQLRLKGGVKASLGINTISSQEALADDATHSIVFLGNVDASLIPSEVRESASHPERP